MQFGSPTQCCNFCDALPGPPQARPSPAMSSRGGAAAAALLGGAALAAVTAWRVLSRERAATVVPLQRLSRKYRSSSRAGLVPAAKGAVGWRAAGRLRCGIAWHGTVYSVPCTCHPHPHRHRSCPRPAGAPQGDLAVLPSQYPAVRRDEGVVEVLHGETIPGAPRRAAGGGGGVGYGNQCLPRVCLCRR